jgi:hypothetical protein
MEPWNWLASKSMTSGRPYKKDGENKPHRATTTSRSVSMILHDYNTNPVIDAPPRW